METMFTQDYTGIMPPPGIFFCGPIGLPQDEAAGRPRITALYERLSHDDEKQGESNSIVNQKKLLMDYAVKNGLPLPMHFTDDGFSGTKFDRPGLIALLQAVEKKRIDTILIKDMSRLGRDYLKVGYIMEELRRRGVRLIAVSENIDTAVEEDDFLPFRNFINELYAKDISRKIKATLRNKGMSGKHLTTEIPYGYRKDPEDPARWVVDEEPALIIRRICQLALEGMHPSVIAKTLKEERIEIPSVYKARFGLGTHRNRRFSDPYNWSYTTVQNILQRREYTGCTVNFRTKKHFKDKRNKYVPQDQWVVFENTQEAIIDQETYDKVQESLRRMKRSRTTDHSCSVRCAEDRRLRRQHEEGNISDADESEFRTGTRGRRRRCLQHPLTGYLYCADCGSRMYYRTNKKTGNGSFVCSNYLKSRGLCPTAHHVSAARVEVAIREKLLKNQLYGMDDDNARRKDIVNKLAETEKRAAELKTVVARLYEDYISGRMAEDRYEILSSACEAELKQLATRAELLKKRENEEASDPELFTDFVKKYPGGGIDYEGVKLFLDRIEVSERERRCCADSPQKVKVIFK